MSGSGAAGGEQRPGTNPPALAGSVAPTPLLHTPYDGSARPFTVGLMPLDLADWIEPDDRLAEHLARKDELLAGAGAPVLLAEAGTQAAQQEVLDLLFDHLPARFPGIYHRDGDAISVTPAGRRISRTAADEAPIAAAARLVQEDLVLMRKGADGHRLAAAALCFPSSWSLVEKFGRSMREIHETVPGFNDGRMGQMVARIFDNLAVDRPSWRLNWSLYSGAELHHPKPKRIDAARMDGAPREGLHVRVERQTLRRLPGCGDILFTIKIHHDPVAAFAGHPDGMRLAAGLREQLLALDPAQLAYKGLSDERDRIAGLLAAQAGMSQRD
ncbi:heme-dependent oxidative N-demethylase family protein [Stappia sp. ICDLI1TA098]